MLAKSTYQSVIDVKLISPIFVTELCFPRESFQIQAFRMQPTNFSVTQQRDQFSSTESRPAGSSVSTGSDSITIPPTLELAGQLNLRPGQEPPQNFPLHQYSVDICEHITTLQQETPPATVTFPASPPADFKTAAFIRLNQGVNSPRLQRDIYLAKNHIQSYMDTHYPGKFALTIPTDNPLKVVAEFVAPFGWWEGAYYKVEFDFSRTNKHNEGPSIRVILAPPVAHLSGEELCLAQIIPHSACNWFWQGPGKAAAKYSSYNFDRVQQMMNVINFLIMDTDFWDYGAGHWSGYPNPAKFERSEQGWYHVPDNRYLLDRREVVKKFSGTEGLEKLKRHISEKIAVVNQKASASISSLSFTVDPQVIYQQKSSSLVFSGIAPLECRISSESSSPDDALDPVFIYSPNALSSCVPMSPIVIEPSGEWGQQLSTKNQVEVVLEHDGEAHTVAHKADYFYPVRLDPLARVAEFHATADRHFFITDREGKKIPTYDWDIDSDSEIEIEIDDLLDKALQTFNLIELKTVLSKKLHTLLNCTQQLKAIYHNNTKIESDHDLDKAINSLKNDIKRKNYHRKNTDKLAVIFVKKAPIKRKWKAILKSTKTMAKVSHFVSQFKLIISQERPTTTQRYRDGMQMGVEANAWLPVMDMAMHGHEEIAVIKLLTDFAHRTLKLPHKKEAITACDANNIIMKSLFMTMVHALQKGKDWLPSQGFLGFLVNAINTHYIISESYADMKYQNMKLVAHAFSGTLDKKNLKDFEFLINYLISALVQINNISQQDRNALRPRLIMNAFVEYLVRVMECEYKNPEQFAAQGLDNEAELTLDKIITVSKTGFSVVTHQLVILDFLLHQNEGKYLSIPTEDQQEQLQILMRNVQKLISADQNDQYAQFMELLFPVAHHWTVPIDFTSEEHQQAIIKTVLEKFHERTNSSVPSQESIDSVQPIEIVENTVLGRSFVVEAENEFEHLDRQLSEQLAGLKLSKNVPVEKDNITIYQHNCHYCGDVFTTKNPLYETKNPVKIERQKKGFINRSGMPIHQECKKKRQEHTKNALSLIRAMERNYPYYTPPSH